MNPHIDWEEVTVRLFSYVKFTDGCWVFTGNCPNGYGNLYVAGKTMLTHRVSWYLHYGKIPADICVLHHCDNPPCVRPTHLFLGTRLDNNRDSIAKGRFHYKPPGENHPMAKLTNANIFDILVRRYEKGETYAKIAEDFDVTYQTIWRVCQGMCYPEITGPYLTDMGILKGSEDVRFNRTNNPPVALLAL